MQIVSIVAMEEPRSMHGDDVRDEKVKVLRHIGAIQRDDVVIGQYTGDKQSTDDERQRGYLDDPGVPKDSQTPTYAQVVLYVNNDRWAGVPFIVSAGLTSEFSSEDCSFAHTHLLLRLGKALNEKKVEIRLQFRETNGTMFNNVVREHESIELLARDELVIRVQPNEAIYFKVNNKLPGDMDLTIEQTELALTYDQRYPGVKMPDAYQRLILDVFKGSKINFVRSDELEEAWRIVDPILDEIDKRTLTVIPYEFGTPEIQQASDVAIKHGYAFKRANQRKDLTEATDKQPPVRVSTSNNNN
jgi:glucose-6-phosphate 1-dehydrogenase